MSSKMKKPVDPVHTPYPYRAGQSLTLADPTGFKFSVDITYEYPFTISPTVVVNLRIKGVVREVVLKFYDRRFGELRERREFDGTRRPQPHTEESEAAFQDLARSGLLAPTLRRLEHASLMWDLFWETPEYDEDEGMKPEWVKLAEEEAGFYYKMQNRYIREVQAYDKLKDFQGRGIPKFFTTVTLQMPSAPSDLESSYFQVPGILIEKINGFNLTNLVAEMPEGPPDLWAEIVQKATDLAVEINRAGVLDEDSQPRNALVTRRGHNTYQVRRIDFGEAMLESDLKFYRKDEPDYFKQCAASSDNPGAIGLVMMAKVKRLTGVELDVVFDEIFPGIDGLPDP
ncbi:hypothetical protein O1611_g5492 [Lasiodiplodia mahajangana]|uniref:Uncharacterized protein n=1 Tax=Lasiodiplodia mahajangana TaxID=1108764 RepID=A0ACC2JL04_9PEZI|nr:hypothetical protein O1611_g5492 [Lasiodiplodia mahajangana]